MGFFAILEEARQPSFEVNKLDINLWCLPGVFGEAFFCDIGILIDIDDSAERRPRFELGLPFGTHADGCEDLAERISDIHDGRLVFGENVRVWDSQTGHSNISLEEAGDTYCVAEVSECGLKRDESDSNFSLWEVEPGISIDGTSHPIYMRLRFSVWSLGRLWKWRKVMGRHGAAVDLRVNDLRGSFDVPEGQDYSDRIIQIEQLNCFVIAPIYFPVQKVNPELKYMRLLEGRRWESYLGRATDLLRKGKLQVVFMRDNHVGTDNEFRGTVSFGSKSNTGWLTWLFATSLFALLLFLFSSPDHISNTFASDFVNNLAESASWIWKTLAGIISVPIVFKAIKSILGYDLLKKISITFKEIEHYIFRFFSSAK